MPPSLLAVLNTAGAIICVSGTTAVSYRLFIAGLYH